MISNILDRISFWSLFTVIVLLPIFFLPFTKIPIETSKGLLLVVGLVVSIIFWVAARFSDGKVVLPKSLLLLSAFGILLVFFISALFSTTVKMSLFGTMFDIGTFYFILGAFLLMLVSSVILKDIKNAKVVLFGLVLSTIFLFLFQTFHIFFPDFLSLGVLGGATDNLLGSWNAFGLFIGFFAVMSLFIVEFFTISKGTKWFFWTLIAFSLILSATVNFPLVWKFFGIFALIIFVFKISFFYGKKPKEEGISEGKHFPALSFFIVVISILFIMYGQFIGEFLPNRLGLSNVEVRPSFIATMSVAKNALMKDPILGAGPNKFGSLWAMYKPKIVNSTQFWDTFFYSGSGLLPTFITTTGSLGVLVWLLFFVLFIISGAKFFFKSVKNNIHWETAVFFVVSVYLFVSSFFYSTGEVMFLLAFAFTGIFIGLSSSELKNKESSLEFSFLDDPRKSFFSILFLVIFMIISVVAGSKYVAKLVSVHYFSKTLTASTIPIAEESISKALSLHQNDLYMRTYAQVYLAKINSIVAKGDSLSEADKADLQANIYQAVNGAQSAINYNKTNYLNFNSLGAVYNTVGLLGVENVYDKAIEAYKEASVLNPLNPGIKLNISRVFFAEKKIQESRDYANEALALKPNYIEALVVLSQIEKSDSNNALAISYAEKALALIPDDTSLLDYVNFLKSKASTPTAVTKQ